MIPSAPVLAIVHNWLDATGTKLDDLAAETGVSRGALLGKFGSMTVDVADRLLCATVGPFAWRSDPSLARIYEGADLARERRATAPANRCARPGCSRVFTPKPNTPKSGRTRQRYCSESCQAMARAYRNGSRPRPGESRQNPLRETCSNGHEQVPGVVRYWGRKRRRRVCLLCERQRPGHAYYRRLRERQLP